MFCAARCIVAAQDLLKAQLLNTATVSQDAALQQLHNSWSISCCSISSLAGSLQQDSCTTFGDQNVSQAPQHPPQATALRAYARAARSEARVGRSRSDDSYWRQQGQPSRLHLGRDSRNLVPTEALKQPFIPEQYSIWQDEDPLVSAPVQVDGSRHDDLEEPLLLRQQLENSALPNQFKRSHFISPIWDEIQLDINRTIKVTKGGKVETLHALVAVGNHDGLLGIGEHSGKNIQKVILDAQLKAYQNVVAIPRYRKHTVYHPIDLKVRKVRMQVWPRQLGFGITANPLITQLCDLAGLDNVTIKVSGRRKNVRNVVQVFVEALTQQSLPHDGVEGSGIYMREVYPRKQLPCGLVRGVDVP
eukprot:GHRR01001835.1.p1 GENE.GHRR01001835.1~~GHRR01001835.1.p1  ORF type:complete len:360 (+),score=95.85 GHRR01001835.1:159-1238(+)